MNVLIAYLLRILVNQFNQCKSLRIYLFNMTSYHTLMQHYSFKTFVPLKRILFSPFEQSSNHFNEFLFLPGYQAMLRLKKSSSFHQ